MEPGHEPSRPCHRLEPGDRVLQFASLSFDLAAEEIFPTWLGGATVVIAPPRLDTSYDELVRFIRLLDTRLDPHFAIGPRDWLRTAESSSGV